MATIDRRMVTIIVEGKHFLFEVKKLARASPYFDRMLNGSFVEAKMKKITLKEVSLDEFQFFRDWLFKIRTSFRGLNRDFLFRMFFFADRFLVEELKSDCRYYLEFWLNNSPIEFSSVVLEAALFINDRKLIMRFKQWFYAKQLRTPTELTVTEFGKSFKAREHFIGSGFKLMTQDCSEDTKSVIMKMLEKHEKLLNRKKEDIVLKAERLEKKFVRLQRELMEMELNEYTYVEYMNKLIQIEKYIQQFGHMVNVQ